MKRFKLFIKLLFISLLGTSVYAQNITVTDFEGTPPNTGGYGVNYALVSNTLTGAGNASSKIGSVTTTSQYPAFQINTSSFVLASNPILTFLIYSAVPVASISGTGRTISVQLNGSGLPSVQVKFGIGADQLNTWIPISLDFSLFPSGSYNQIQFSIVGANNTDLNTYYFDNIVLKVPASAATSLPLYYESFSAGNGNNYTPGSGDASTFTGWDPLGTVTGSNVTTIWPPVYSSDPASSDGFSLNLLSASTTTSPFTITAPVKGKPNLFIKFGILWNTSSAPGSDWRPNIDVNIDNTGWVPLSTIPGFGSSYPTTGKTWSDVSIALLDVDGNPLPVGNLLQVRIQSSPLADYDIDDLYISQNLPTVTPPTTTTSPVAVTVYYEPFNLNLSSECYPCYANTMTGWAAGATVGGQMTVEAMSSSYSKSYTFTSAATDDFIGFWGNKTTDVTFSGINISGVSDLAISFGLAQLYMTDATSLPQVEISIDGSDWLHLTKAGNNTQWGVTDFGGTFTGVSLPVKYGNSPLTGNSLSVRFYGLNGGQIDDLKITGTTVAGVSTTPGVAVRDTLYYEPFNLVGFGSSTTQAYAETITGFASGATVTGPITIDHSWSNQYYNPYITVQDQGPLMALWGDHITDVTFAGINIANQKDLAISFVLAQNYSIYTAIPQISIRVDAGPWIPITATGFGTAWPSVAFTPNSPVTFSGIMMPVADQNGTALTGSTLSINFKTPLSYSCQIDNIRVTGVSTGTTPPPPANVSVTGITVTSDSATVVIGYNLHCSATVLPANANIKTVIWSVANQGGAVAFINSVTGVLNAAGTGLVTVTASATDGSGVKGSLVITIVGVPSILLRSIHITPSPSDAIAVVYVGGTLQMTANVLPKTAADTSVTWSVVAVTRGIYPPPVVPPSATIDEVTGLLTGVDPGPIFVVANANDASGLTDTLLVHVSNVTDIAKAEQSDFSLYPNPATTGIYISGAKNIGSVEVFDIVGLPVSSVVYSSGYINITEIPAGTYFVKISTVDKKIINKKIVKN